MTTRTSMMNALQRNAKLRRLDTLMSSIQTSMERNWLQEDDPCCEHELTDSCGYLLKQEFRRRTGKPLVDPYSGTYGELLQTLALRKQIIQMDAPTRDMIQ